MIEDDDEEPTAEELREADALARALERGHAPPGTPENVLETAALLRHSRDGGALDPERQRAILEDVFARARPRRAPARARHWLLGLLGLAAAGAASIVLVRREETTSALAALPPPPRALLEAEIEVAGARTASLASLTAETASYRVAMYSSLRERYGR